jgi:thiol-disulfide isomerase/thioredoxin
MNAAKLTRNPTLTTAILSVATIAGYVAYRLTAGAPDLQLQVAPATAGAPLLADQLPEIVLSDMAGTPTPLATWSDGAMLVNFWATWCAPCLREIPMLKVFHDEHESIEVIGIAVDRIEPVLEYAAEMAFNYPVLIGLADAYDAMAIFRNEAQVMPFTAFTAPGGAVLGVHYGELDGEHLENFAATIELLDAGTIDLVEARQRMAAAEAHGAEDH